LELDGGMNMKDISGKRVFLTGASRGIGQQIAYAFAGLGCHLILHARKKENLETTLTALKAFKVEVDSVEAELSDSESVESMLLELDQLNKQVDIVYCNAAVGSDSQDIYHSSRAEWDRVMQVNFYTLVRINEYFLPKLVEQGFGRIINVSTGMEDQPNLAPYSVSKAAVERFTRDLSKQMKAKNVLMNCIDPGWIKTDLGGPDAFSEVESVIPGMIVPALLEDDGPVSQLFKAQAYVGKTYDTLGL
jgi:NAD(P)-dependent dehydrogenase (short-subunit alcohol dehydrogenase family)